MERRALRAAAEEVLRAETGAASIVRVCPRCGSAEHGRPTAVGVAGRPVHVSISYAEDLVAVAWSPEGAVGIDVERGGPDRQEWTRVEALLKAAGVGLDGDPGDPSSLPSEPIALPPGYVGTVVGVDVSWRVAGPAARARPATR